MNEKELSNEVIRVSRVHKQFGRRVIFENIDFNLPRETIVGICGANGSGKSVFLRIIAGLMLPDNGEIRVFGDRIGAEVEFPRSTGIIIDAPGFLLNLSGFQNLQLLGKISGGVRRDRMEHVFQRVGLDLHDRRPVGVYSTGMRQRLGIAQAILEDPNLLILDEVTNGLDFDGQDRIHELLLELRGQGKTILITSHSREEISSVCDDAYLMAEGKLEPYRR